MSFHGGLLGVSAAAWLFCRRRSIPLLRVGDALALATPPGLFFGRLANFVNGELYGRVSAVPWAMVFPNGGPLPRHPSELYEAILEGPVLWLAVWGATRACAGKTGGGVAAFLLGYGLFRFLLEFTREPDPQLGFLLGPFTMGQLLSIVIVAAGGWILCRSRKAD
jgi:phosphatidylglycerol:prolipoprotein diacylglycerol transferase